MLETEDGFPQKEKSFLLGRWSNFLFYSDAVSDAEQRANVLLDQTFKRNQINRVACLNIALLMSEHDDAISFGHRT